MKELELTPDSPGVRLDVYLAGAGLGLTRSQAQRLIDEGLALVSGVARKANYRLRINDTLKVFVPAPEPVEVLAEDIPVKVLYEDDDIVVVDKPAGMVTHPAAGNFTGTLVNALLYRPGGLSRAGGALRPGVVHRLDKDTSGVLVMARSDRAYQGLIAAFKAHTNTRQYVAVTVGDFKDEEGTVAVSIGRHVTDRKKMSPITFKGRPAVTHYRVIEHFRGAAYIALKLDTGRTHQIRVHMAHIGHPIAGDRVYGGANAARLLGMKVPRHMLHARLLGITHPVSGEYMEFSADPPEDLLKLLEFLRKSRV